MNVLDAIDAVERALTDLSNALYDMREEDPKCVNIQWADKEVDKAMGLMDTLRRWLNG